MYICQTCLSCALNGWAAHHMGIPACFPPLPSLKSGDSPALALPPSLLSSCPPPATMYSVSVPQEGVDARRNTSLNTCGTSLYTTDS